MTVASSRKKVLILMIAVMLIMTLAITGFLIYKTVSSLFTEILSGNWKYNICKVIHQSKNKVATGTYMKIDSVI